MRFLRFGSYRLNGGLEIIVCVDDRERHDMREKLPHEA